ncbi:U1 snRNP protein [Vermiconidia calcicola]|uniref:U1 snRNP protein n=1 Tax=Vermiconidia calcicola TaxID=1690605 RepID=A0ACC3MXS8_9PEZI|nr:U1 snRNP protein [Vermiconidia calcicola]
MSEWKTAKTPDGRIYYYKPGGVTQWEKPADLDDAEDLSTAAAPQHDPAQVAASWKETLTQDGRPYYWNTITKVTTYDVPEAFAKQKQTERPASALVAGGGQSFGNGDYPAPERRMERRNDRDHGLPQKPSFDGGRGGPWEQRQENSGFRGAMPAKADEPEYGTYEQAEEAFFKLLRKSNISPNTSWQDALRTVIREKEYRALKDPKERRQAFEKYCIEARAQEKGKEKERREKLREDFLKMLHTHDDIKHYTRWKTARSIIEREAVFRSAGDEDERRQIFDEYILGLKKKHAEDEVKNRDTAMRELDSLLEVLIIDPDTKWADAHQSIQKTERFQSDDTFRALSDADILFAFDAHIKALERLSNDAKQNEKRLQYRRERQARDGFKQLLQEMRGQGKIRAGTKWSDVHPLIAQDERYLNLIGNLGSNPLDLFWDAVEEEDRKLRAWRNDALDVLEDKRYEMTLETTLDDFIDIMRTDPRTASFNTDQLRLIYDRLMAKIKKRAEEDRAFNERSQRKAIDGLRSIIKHLEPPVRVSDSYEDIAARLQGYPEYSGLDEEARRAAFDKHVRRLKEKEDDLERERARRDRGRDHRNGSRRDRDRRPRTRTPEVDAYEADRRKAQADRERQYRKASFGLTPPPRERERRDDRDDRYRRHDRHESMSIYDRERREREMERERSYISRADPRDRGKTLDYGDEDAVGSRPGSIRKRRESDGSAAARRDTKYDHIKISLTNSSSKAQSRLAGDTRLDEAIAKTNAALAAAAAASADSPADADSDQTGTGGASVQDDVMDADEAESSETLKGDQDEDGDEESTA